MYVWVLIFGLTTRIFISDYINSQFKLKKKIAT
jgi:hypothetical protein